MTARPHEDAAVAPGLPQCGECRAPLAADQRYCTECGARRGDLPPWFAALFAGRSDGSANDPPTQVDPDTEERKGADWMPAPRAIAVAILGMLAFGVLAGSLVKPDTASLARTLVLAVPAPTSAAAPSAPAPPTSSGSPASAVPSLSGTPASSGGASSSGASAGGSSGAASQGGSAPTQAEAGVPSSPASEGVGGGERGAGGSTGLLGLPPVKHVFVVMLSSQRFADSFGPGSHDPYLSKTLPRKGELIQNYYAVAPSPLANAIALLSGQGPTPQTAAGCPVFATITPGTMRAGQVIGSGCVYPSSAPTLAGQLIAKHLTWRAYVQGIGNGPPGQPKTCRHPALGSADTDQAPRPGDPYVTWRNPFVYFGSLIAGSACRRGDVDLDRLAADLNDAAKAPTLAYIVASPCHDGSDQPCAPSAKSGLAAADAFLQATLRKIEASAAYKDAGLIAVTFDEAPQTGPDADPSACCGNPSYPNLSSASTQPIPPTSTAPAVTTTPTGTTPTTSATTPTIPTSPTTPSTSSSPATPITQTAPATLTTPTTTTPTTTTPAPTTPGGPTTPTGGGGQVGLLLISKFVKAGTTDLVDYYNHYSLLASIEDLFGLKRLGYAKVPSLPVFDAATYNAKPSP